MEYTETTFYVRYAETDAMGIVHHASYIVWFEEGRSHYLRVRGCSYAQLAAAGYFLTVTEVEARYRTPARYGDRVTVRTKLESLRSRSLSMTYEVYNADNGALLVTGRTEFIDNVNVTGMLHCAILRSPFAHARIEKTCCG